MTEQQGRGVQVLSQLVKDLSRMDSEKARSIIDALNDGEIADVLEAHAAALKATDDGDVFVESVAARLSGDETDEVRQ